MSVFRKYFSSWLLSSNSLWSWLCVCIQSLSWMSSNKNVHVFARPSWWGICLQALQLAWKMIKNTKRLPLNPFSGRRAHFFKKRISLLMDGTKSYFTGVPLDVSQSPTTGWFHVWQIHSHNASLIYSCPQVCRIIINETGEIRRTLLSVLLTGLRDPRKHGGSIWRMFDLQQGYNNHRR